MSTNDEPEVTEAPAEEPSIDAVADLAAAKAKAESTKPEAEETAQVPNTETAEVKEEAQAEPKTTSDTVTTLTKEPDHDLDWYKTAYDNSTKEALRLKAELDKKVETPPPPLETPVSTGDDILTPEQLYIRQKQNEEITEAFSAITDKYPTLKEKDVYDKFVAEANLVGKVIVESEKRYPSPKELYEKTAIILGLTPDNSEAIGSAIKNAAASPKIASGPAAPPTQSKVTEEMVDLNLKMYPGKSRQEIIEELEPHIN